MADGNTQENSTQQKNYLPKRLHTGKIDPALLRDFFAQTSQLKEKLRISSPSFSSLFHEFRTESGVLIYTDHQAEQDERLDFLFRTDMALIFRDWVIEQGEIEGNLKEILDRKGTKSSTASSLVSVVNYASRFAKNSQLSESENNRLHQLLSESSIRGISKFIVKYIDDPLGEQAEESPEEDEEEVEEKPVVGAGAPRKKAPSSEEDEEEQIEGGETATDPQTPEEIERRQTQVPSTQEEIRSILFNPVVMQESARFSQIALIQLEQFHGLPEGSLQNSPWLRGLMSQKVQSFFGTVLPGERYDALLNDPKERLKLIREFNWMILNDAGVRGGLIKSLTHTAQTSDDPELKAHIDEEIAKAERGEGISELVAELAQKPELQEIVTNVRNANSVTNNTPQQVKALVSQDLLRQLQAAGVHPDKWPALQENILNRLHALTKNKYSVKVLDVLSERNFKLLFSQDVPDTPEFREFLKELWINQRSMIARVEGDVTINAEEQFAIDEALALLDENNPEITKEQSEVLFEETILKDTNNTIVNHRVARIPLDSTELYKEFGKLKEEHQKLVDAYFKEKWDGLSREQLEAFAQFANIEVEIVVQIPQPPPEFRWFSAGDSDEYGYSQFTQEAVDPGLQSDYMPANAQPHSMMATARNYLEKSDKFNRISRLTRGLKRVRGRFGKKGVEEAAETIVKAGASALPGGPVTGELASWITTKKGRRKLALTLGGMIAPLFTLGGQIGAGLGGIAGFLIGGPAGIPMGALAGSWLGMGAENVVRSWFDGGSPSIAYQGPGLDSLLPSSSAGTGTGGAAATGAISAEAATAAGTIAEGMTATGAQAVYFSLGTIAATAIFTNMVFNNALLADFPQVDPLATLVPGTQGKQSEYVTIEKRVFITGCPNNRCENPDFPIRAEYSITIRPKDDYNVSLTSATDTLKVNYSTKAWEEEGKTPPSALERVKSITDFPELYEGLTLGPSGDSEVTLSYTEEFDESYNHSGIINTFEIEIAVEGAGTDSALTGEVIYVGNYSQGAGCWPTDGIVTQLPDGKGETYDNPSHRNVDAFDIAGPEGTFIYTPFAGDLCFGQLDPGYGNHLTLQAPEGRFVFAHFRDMIIKTPGECIPNTPAGTFIGWMGNTGNTYGLTGVHLHFELKGNKHTPSALGALMPAGNSVQQNESVRTCYP